MNRIVAKARQVSAVIVAVVLVVTVGGSPAQAATTIYGDGFESCCGWTYFTSDGSPKSFWYTDPNWAYRERSFAVLHAPTDPNGWAEVGREFHPLSPRTCSATIYVRPIGNRPSRVNFEIIEPNSWTYIKMAQYSVTGDGYRQIKVGPWTNTYDAIYLRVSLLGGVSQFLYVDEVALTCSS